MQYYYFRPQNPKIGFKWKLPKPKPFDTYQVYSWLYLFMRLPNYWWIFYKIGLAWELSKSSALVFIQHSCCISVILNFQPRSSDPWWEVLSVFQGYLVRHLVFTNLSMIIAFLWSYFVYLKHPMTVSTIIIALIII